MTFCFGALDISVALLLTDGAMYMKAKDFTGF
jgi:hypothetical protein